MKRKRGEKSPDGEIWGMTQKVGADYKDPTWTTASQSWDYLLAFLLASLLTSDGYRRCGRRRMCLEVVWKLLRFRGVKGMFGSEGHEIMKPWISPYFLRQPEALSGLHCRFARASGKVTWARRRCGLVLTALALALACRAEPEYRPIDDIILERAEPKLRAYDPKKVKSV